MKSHGSLARPVLLLMVWTAATATAQQQDPRIGEWREDRYPGAVGLYTIYEDLGNGMTRAHFTENLAIPNRLHQDTRCDGRFYPYLDAEGMPTDRSSSCTIVDSRTVRLKLARDTPNGREQGEATWTLSGDGNRFTSVVVWRNAAGETLQSNERHFTRNAENCLNHAQDELFRDCARRTRPPRD